MAKRPFLKSSITDLEKLVEENIANTTVLNQVEFELRHRASVRAKGLRLVIQEQLNVAGDGVPYGINPKKSQHFEANNSAAKTASVQQTKPQRSKSGEAPFKASRDLIRNFIEALKIEVDHIRKRSYSTTVEVRNGKKVKEGSEGYLYVFPNTDDVKLNDDAPVMIVIGGEEVAGTVVSAAKMQIVISLDEDHGSIIHFAQIKSDDSFLVERLREKFSEISEGESAGSFNLTIAQKAMGEMASVKTGFAVPAVDRGAMNDRQWQAVSTASQHEVFFLWGPPGTGKTFTLAKIIETFYARKDKILMVSNTNLAVDTLLEKVCEAFYGVDEGFEKGAVIRFGNMVKPELVEKFGAYVNVDMAVERLGRELDVERKHIETTIAEIRAKAAPLFKATEMFDQMASLSVQVHEIQKRQPLLLVKKEKHESDQTRLHDMVAALEKKLERAKGAGKIKRFFAGLDPEKISAKLVQQKGKIKAANLSIDELARQISDNAAVLSSLHSEMKLAQRAVGNRTRKEVDALLAKTNARLAHLAERLKEIEQQLSQLREEVLKNCRVLASTATQTYLKSKSFDTFDVVVVDEASMLPLPLVAYVAGLSNKNVVVTGDFRQLPPIVSSKHPAVEKFIGQDVFTKAGVAGAVGSGRPPSNLVQLNTQYRMEEKICGLINRLFYGGQLVTHPSAGSKKSTSYPDVLSDVLTIVDTSSQYPFANLKPGTYSRYNILHAVAVRNLAYHLHQKGLVQSTEDLGIISPYSAQAKLVNKLCAEIGLDLVQSGTVHSFQGNEKNIILLDISDSFGVAYLSQFVKSASLEASGAKLTNVALSRARSRLVVFANIPFLESKLPRGAFLRTVLTDMRNQGRVHAVEDIIKLGPGGFPVDEAGPEHLAYPVGSATIFNESSFDKGFRADMESAERAIIIFSGFCTPNRVAFWGDVFRRKAGQGVAIRAVTRPPETQGNIDPQAVSEAIDAMRKLGVVVDLRASIHEKICFIDDRVLWHGSLNPLSHTGRTDESMIRINSHEACSMMAEFQCYRFKREMKDTSPIDILARQENPQCGRCSAPTVFHTKARNGPYFYCVNKCGWTANLDSAGKIKMAGRQYQSPRSGGDVCEKCGAPMVVKTGRYGEFMGCSSFPKCKNTRNMKN